MNTQRKTVAAIFVAALMAMTALVAAGCKSNTDDAGTAPPSAAPPAPPAGAPPTAPPGVKPGAAGAPAGAPVPPPGPPAAGGK